MSVPKADMYVNRLEGYLSGKMSKSFEMSTKAVLDAYYILHIYVNDTMLVKSQKKDKPDNYD